MYSDLHCHPSMIPFNHGRNSNYDGGPDFHIYNIPRKSLKILKKQKKKGFKQFLASFPQSDMGTLSRADVRLVFASLYPPETGFFMGNDRKGINAKVVRSAVGLLSKSKFLGRLAGILLFPLNLILARTLNQEGWVRDTVQKLLMKFHKKRIDFIQGQIPDHNGKYYNYFDELQMEAQMYQNSINKAPPGIRKYSIITHGNELNSVIDEEDRIAVVLSIEGMGMLAQERDLDNEQTKLKPVSLSELIHRIHWLKENHFFFVTFSHHFNNNLTGHAKSLPQIMQEITDQEPGMNSPINSNGIAAFKELLSLKDDYSNDTAKGRRVLIDVKHMSALSRQQYYEIIDKNHRNENEWIPVIASHCGYANRKSLGDLIFQGEQDLEKDDSFEDNCYTWGINLCDEDIAMVVKTDGLIGLSFDQRIMGLSPRKKIDSKKQWAWLITQNILAFAEASGRTFPSNPGKIWDCMTIGTDFDGFIDPVNTFATAEYFDEYSNLLLEVLKGFTEQNRSKYYMTKYDPEELVHKFCIDNAYQFVKKNFK
ncbi:MAG: hypothetical protein KAR17_23550 [Cyclobacteriaceae bacterium]|nr:hypothetical protein [Cyclobacteriaceae bacterium]